MRPTADKVRGAIFNILSSRSTLEGRSLLDLFCGSGALGVEALSRGAASVLFVDRSPRACLAARDNVARSGFAARGEVRRLPLPAGLARIAAGGRRFDGVLADPPYRRGLARATVEALAAGELVAPGAWIVVEHAPEEELPERSGGLQRVDDRRYGSTAISFYEAEGST